MAEPTPGSCRTGCAVKAITLRLQHRISELDFETIIARCKVEPRARLLACPSEGQVAFTFGPPDGELVQSFLLSRDAWNRPQVEWILRGRQDRGLPR